MQNKPSKWVSGYKHGPAASYTQITRMGLFLNVATSKFEPLDSTWDNLHSGGMFISDDNKIYFRDETNKDIYINSPADNQLALYASSGVGVNVTPAEMLHVVDATAEGGVLIDNTATDGNPILAFGLSGTKTFTMGIDDGDSDKFKIFSGAAIDGTSEFVIDGSGNVGIGTASPASNQGFSQTIETNNTTSGFDIMLGNSSAGTDSFLGQLSANRGDECLSAISFKTDGATNAGNIQFQTQIAGGALAIKQTISSAGEITAPLQPAFLAGADGTQTNLPAASTTILWATEIYDQGGDFASSTFTAPVTGKYQLSFNLVLLNLDSAANIYNGLISTSNRDYWITYIDPTEFAGDITHWSLNGTVLADMDASDTAIVKLYQQSGTAQTDVSGDAYFSGFLAC